MTLVGYLRAVRARWVALLICAAISMACAAGYSRLQEPIYAANVQLFISTGSGDSDLTALAQAGTFTQQRVKSYSDIVSSPAVLEPVIKTLKLPYSTAQLSENVTTVPPADTVLLDITVQDPSPRRAADIANLIAKQFPRVVDNIETQPGQRVSPVKVSVTRYASAPTAPISPNITLNLAVGLALGLAIGFAYAVMAQVLDRTIRSAAAAGEIASAPVLAAIPRCAVLDSSSVAAYNQGAGLPEEFRHLRTNIRFLSIDGRVDSFVVTGSLPGEGKTTVASRLALTLAEAGTDVVLIDGDLRKPRIAEAFAIPAGIGLTNVLLGDVPVGNALQRWRDDLGLYVLTAGPIPPNPSELLGSTRLTEVVATLNRAGMTVVFDSPPLLPVTDATLIAKATRGALVVAHVGKTKEEQLKASVDALRTVGAEVLGIVANSVRQSAATYQEYSAYAAQHSRVGVGRSNSPKVESSAVWS
ncbi:polysaccharide biosynthesis tyrosine autokinase [Cryptosporangium sp. NPDC048952]|uniref:polysaccharide biosynthesis tyrosine autokinase n=1 Tax=Cryptosporangium sp. NPDC048952 TaxID=3363961 RepID=UPI00372452C9